MKTVTERVFDLVVDKMDDYMGRKRKIRRARWNAVDYDVFLDIMVNVFVGFDSHKKAPYKCLRRS